MRYPAPLPSLGPLLWVPVFWLLRHCTTPGSIQTQQSGKSHWVWKWSLVKVKGSFLLPSKPWAAQSLIHTDRWWPCEYHDQCPENGTGSFTPQQKQQAAVKALRAFVPIAEVLISTPEDRGWETARLWLGSQPSFVPMTLLKMMCQPGLWGKEDTKSLNDHLWPT